MRETKPNGQVRQVRFHGPVEIPVVETFTDAMENGRKLMIEIRDAEGRHWLHCAARIVVAETKPAKIGVEIDAIALPVALVVPDEPSTAPLGKVARRSKRGDRKVREREKLREEGREERIARDRRIRQEWRNGASREALERRYQLPEKTINRIVGVRS